MVSVSAEISYYNYCDHFLSLPADIPRYIPLFRGKAHFFLKKLVIPFILPPGIFILALLCSGVLVIFLKRRKIGIFNLALGLLLEVIAYPAGLKNAQDIEWASYLPRASSLEVASDALHEYWGIVFYKLAH